MSEDLSWLPPLVTLSDLSGDWDAYLARLYEGFVSDFITSKPVYPGKRWSLKRQPIIKGKEATFWHIVSEGGIESERLPDLRRCECIRWPRAIIDVIFTDRVRVWRNRRGSEERILIALPDFSYLVVLADRGEYVMLWTAYNVEREHARRKLRREYEDYRLNGLAPSP